jgi:hypothetical protein
MFGLLTFYMTFIIILLVLIGFASSEFLKRHTAYAGPSQISPPNKLFLIFFPIILAALVFIFFTNKFVVECIRVNIGEHGGQIADSIFIGSVVMTGINVLAGVYQQIKLLYNGTSINSTVMYYCEMVSFPPLTIILDLIWYKKSQDLVDSL